MLFLGLANPLQFLYFVIGLLAAITVHEAAHAYVAYKLGDSTAKEAGRVSINPFVHLDPLGTIFLFLAGFGWGKPVPVDPRNLSNPKLDELKIALAGPLSNFILMALILIFVRFFNPSEDLFTALIIIAQINIILMVFNLIPIPPLDGGNILKIILPDESFEAIQRLGVPLLFAFIIFSRTTNFLSTLFESVSKFFFNLFLQ